MSNLKLKIVDVAYHRNGVCGIGFYAILFEERSLGRMIASLFDGPNPDHSGVNGYCAVYSVGELQKGNIQFAAGNSWRGDDFEAELRPLLKVFLEKHSVVRD